MALHPHQSGGLALSQADMTMHMQLLLKQQLQSMGHINAELKALSDHLSQLGQLSGMVKAMFIGMVGAPRSLNYGLRYGLLSGSHGKSGITPGGVAATSSSGFASGEWPGQEKILAEIRERAEVDREEKLKTAAIINAVYEQKEQERAAKDKQRQAEKIARREAEEQHFARKRAENEKRQELQHQLRMERMAQWEKARGQLQQNIHKDLLELHASSVAQMRKDLGLGETTATGAPNMPLHGGETVTQQVEKEIKEKGKAAAEVAQQTSKPLSQLLVGMAAASAPIVHPMARAMAHAAATSPAYEYTHQPAGEQGPPTKPSALKALLTGLGLSKGNAAVGTRNWARLFAEPFLGVFKQGAGLLGQVFHPLLSMFGLGGGGGGGGGKTSTPAGGGAGGFFLSLAKSVDHLKESLDGAARGFVMMTTIGQSLIAAASPDLWNTLTGSIELLVGRIGQALIPQVLELAAFLQKAAAMVHEFNKAHPDVTNFLSSTAMLALRLTALATVVRLAAVAMSGFTRKQLAVTGGLFLLEQIIEGIGNKDHWTGHFAFTPAWFKKMEEQRKGPNATEQAEELNQYIKTNKEVMEAPEVKLIFAKYGKDYKAAAEHFHTRYKEAVENRSSAEIGGEKLFPPNYVNEQPKWWWGDTGHMLRKKYVESSHAMNIFSRAEDIARAMAANKPLPAEQMRWPKELTPEGKSAKMQLLMALSSFKATPTYSSIEEQYKKTQITALGDDPLTQEIKKMRMENLEQIYQALERGNQLSAETKSLWESIKFGRQ